MAATGGSNSIVLPLPPPSQTAPPLPSSSSKSTIITPYSISIGSEVTENQKHRQNHRDIEKRRRDKMNTYIGELAKLVPMCGALNRKLDKLTVLRLAVQHVRSLKDSGSTTTEISDRPSYIRKEILNRLILQMAEGFVFVVSCDRGKILFTSESVKDILSVPSCHMFGQSLFDFIHPKDVAKVKEQLLTADMTSPKEKFIDAKTMQPVKTEIPQQHSALSPGSRRSFYCRMKSGNDEVANVHLAGNCEHDTKRRKAERTHYVIVYCSGYIKSWLTSVLARPADDDELSDADTTVSCLVALAVPVEMSVTAESDNGDGGIEVDVASSSSDPSSPVGALVSTTFEFFSRHTADGKFTFVDHRITPVTGYLPQELIGSSVYDYCLPDDSPHLLEMHRAALRTTEDVYSEPYHFKTKSGAIIILKTKGFAFRNPASMELESIICTSTVYTTKLSNEETTSSVKMETCSIVIDYPKALPNVHCLPYQAKLNGPEYMPMNALDVNIDYGGENATRESHGHQKVVFNQVLAKTADGTAATSTQKESNLMKQFQSPYAYYDPRALSEMNGYMNQIAASSNNSFAGAHQFYNNCFDPVLRKQQSIGTNSISGRYVNAMRMESDIT